jgi:hypothetical protein
VLECCPFLEKISFGSTEIKDAFSVALAEGDIPNNVKTISFLRGRVPEDELLCMPALFPNLRLLVLTKCNSIDWSVFDFLNAYMEIDHYTTSDDWREDWTKEKNHDRVSFSWAKHEDSDDD